MTNQTIKTTLSYLLVLIANLFISFSTTTEVAASPWLPKKGEHLVNFDYSATTKLSNQVRMEAYYYMKLQQEINDLIVERYGIDQITGITDDAKLSRKAIWDKAIDAKKKMQKRLRIIIPTSSSWLGIESGLSDKFSLGANLQYGKSIDIFGKNRNYTKGNLFLKRHIFKNKKWMVSGKIGIGDDNFDDRFHGSIGFNIGRAAPIKLKKKKKNIKLITSMGLEIFSSRQVDIASHFSQAIEFMDRGIIVEMGHSQRYNKNYEYAYKYYYKDNLRLAKNFNNYKMPGLNNLTLSIGVYQEYFGKTKRLSNLGYNCGIAFKI